MIGGGWFWSAIVRVVIMSIMLFKAGSSSLPASRWESRKPVADIALAQICFWSLLDSAISPVAASRFGKMR